MDLFNLMAEKVDKPQERPYRMVCPSSEAVPQDGMLKYITIETLGDLLAEMPANTVIMFRDDQKDLLQCVVDYPHLFGWDAIIVTGVPGVAYPPEFESVTWQLNRLPYHTVVNDLVELERRHVELAEEKKGSSIYEKEKAQYTRKSGDIKAFTGFTTAKPADAEDEANGEEPRG